MGFILYLFVIVCSAMYAVLYDQYSSAVLLIVVLLLPVILLLTLLASAFFVTIELDEKIITTGKGKEAIIKLKARNKGILPIGKVKILLRCKWKTEKRVQKRRLLLTLAAKEEKEVYCRITPEYAGIIEIRIKHFVVYDWMHIWMIYRWNKKMGQIVVMPALRILEDLNIKNNPFIAVESDQFSKTRSGDDPSEVFGIRKYREGDRLQQIHWKLSRKRSEWVVKEFSLPTGAAVIVLMELYLKPKTKDTVLITDYIAEQTGSLLYTLLLQKQAAVLALYRNVKNEYEEIAIDKEENLYEGLEMLMEAGYYYDKHKVLSYQRTLGRKQKYTHVFYISTLIEDTQKEELSVNFPGAAVCQLHVNTDIEKKQGGIYEKQQKWISYNN